MALPALGFLKHALSVYVKIAPARRSQITETDSIPESLQDSSTNKTLVNPRNHPALNDTRHIDLEVPQKAQYLEDEAVLAAFMRGFFGGRVFAPERALLRFFRPDMVKFSGELGSTDEVILKLTIAQL